MPYRSSLGGSKGEGQAKQVQHGSGGVAKKMLILSLLFFPLLQSCVLINVEALKCVPQPIEPLTAMVLVCQIK